MTFFRLLFYFFPKAKSNLYRFLQNSNKLKVAVYLEISWLAASDLDSRPGGRGSIPGAAVRRSTLRRVRRENKLFLKNVLIPKGIFYFFQKAPRLIG